MKTQPFLKVKGERSKVILHIYFLGQPLPLFLHLQDPVNAEPLASDRVAQTFNYDLRATGRLSVFPMIIISCSRKKFHMMSHNLLNVS